MEAAVVNSQKPHMRFDRKNALIGLAILIVLIAAGVLYYRSTHKAEPVSKVPQYSEQDLIKELNKKYATHDFSGAIELVKGQRTIDQPNIQLLLAAAYGNAGQFKSALGVYDSLEQKTPLNEMYASTAAVAAEGAKDYKKAIDYYKKAKSRMDKKTANVDQVQVYDYKITELEKKL